MSVQNGSKVETASDHGEGVDVSSRLRVPPGTTTEQVGDLDIAIDPVTGQIRSIHDRKRDLHVLRCEPGCELELNGRGMRAQLDTVETAADRHYSSMHIEHYASYGSGYRLHVHRFLTRGGVGLHTGSPHSLHLRYRIKRVPWQQHAPTQPSCTRAPVESPLHVESLGVLGAPLPWFGQKTHMRALALGGSGPREHVGVEDGPVAEVVPWLKNTFRAIAPGQQTVAGALYYHRDDHRFVWLIQRRPHVGGSIQYDVQRQCHQFHYFTPLGVHKELGTPDVSLFWGRGLDEAEQVLADQFDMFMEPPDWWYRTSWFWLHPMWQRQASFTGMGEAADILLNEGGITGFGIGGHDIPPGGRDVDNRSPRPNPLLGGASQLRKAVQRLNDQGAHTFVWMSNKGVFPAGDYRPQWAMYGIDGQPAETREGANQGVWHHVINCADPDWQEDFFRWVRYYVEHIGVTGIFWDSGGQPVPPDFGDKPYLRYPSESMVAERLFLEKVYQFGQSLRADFFMWSEGMNVDMPANAYGCHNKQTPGTASGPNLLHRIAHRTPQRLVWRSLWPHDVATGFCWIDPVCDIGGTQDPQRYRDIAAKPMNRWISEQVRQRGIRHAVGLGEGLSLWDEFIVASPGVSGPVDVPAARCPARRLEHVISGQPVDAETHDHNGATIHRFHLPTSGAYRFG